VDEMPSVLPAGHMEQFPCTLMLVSPMLAVLASLVHGFKSMGAPAADNLPTTDTTLFTKKSPSSMMTVWEVSGPQSATVAVTFPGMGFSGVPTSISPHTRTEYAFSVAFCCRENSSLPRIVSQ